MNKKIFLGLFMSCTLFFNTNSLAFANSEKINITSNEIKLQSLEKIGFNVNYNALNSDTQTISVASEIGSDILWGAGVGAGLGLIWGLWIDNGNHDSAPINVGFIFGPILGLGIGAISGAIWGAGKVSGTQVEKKQQ